MDTARTESGFKSRDAPLLAESSFVARRPSRDEIQANIVAEGWNADDATVVKRVKRRLIEDQEIAWMAESRNALLLTDLPETKKRFTTSKHSILLNLSPSSQPDIKY